VKSCHWAESWARFSGYCRLTIILYGWGREDQASQNAVSLVGSSSRAGGWLSIPTMVQSQFAILNDTHNLSFSLTHTHSDVLRAFNKVLNCQLLLVRLAILRNKMFCKVGF
jgi:hypothetical protein